MTVGVTLAETMCGLKSVSQSVWHCFSSLLALHYLCFVSFSVTSGLPRMSLYFFASVVFLSILSSLSHILLTTTFSSGSRILRPSQMHRTRLHSPTLDTFSLSSTTAAAEALLSSLSSRSPTTKLQPALSIGTQHHTTSDTLNKHS